MLWSTGLKSFPRQAATSRMILRRPPVTFLARQIAAIGNLLRHEYQRTDVMATWNIVEVYLPTLAIAIERLMMEADQREKE